MQLEFLFVEIRYNTVGWNGVVRQGNIETDGHRWREIKREREVA